MPSLTLWAERDFDIDVLEKYCASTRKAVGILADLWVANASALGSMAAIIEESSNQKNDEEVLNNFLEDKIGDRVVQALFQYGKGGIPLEAQHLKTLRRCLIDHEQKLPPAMSQLREVSAQMTRVSSELSEARKSKQEADQALLSAIMSKSELEKRFTPSAVGTSQLPASAVNIMKKCDERIRAAQASQLACGERLTDLREQLEEITSSSAQSRRENLQIIENVEKRKLNGIASTANEILNLQMLLSSSLTQETDGIIEQQQSTTTTTTTMINLNNQSTVSQGSGLSSQSIQGLDWVERIQRIDASDRSLFVLSQIAEEVANHESEDELKICDLEAEIEKIKAQIAQLQQGKGSFADRLAADYAGMSIAAATHKAEYTMIQQSDIHTRRLLSLSPKFSLPLPLKTDCYAKGFWSGYAREERHDTEVDFVVDSVGDEACSAEWDLLAYEQLLLGYFEMSSRYPHLLSNSQWVKLRNVMQYCRIKLRIPTKTHEAIVEFLLPDSVAVQEDIPPLDLRFRICRLLVVVGAENSASSSSSSWIKRQVQFLDFAIKCLAKEDTSGSVNAHVVPAMTLIASQMDTEVLTELLENLTTFADDNDNDNNNKGQIPIPRGVIHQMVSRIWKLCVNLEEENGLAAETNLVAAFLHNFLTGRQYPYHNLWLGFSLWEAALAASPLLSASLAKQVNEILKPGGGEKYIEKICGDVFYFGRGAAGAASIQAAVVATSPRNHYEEKNLRILAFDMAYLLKLTVPVRESIVAALTDYRRKLEPEALEISVDIYRNSLLRVNAALPACLWPSETDLMSYMQSMSEFFVSESARAVCNRLVEPQKFLDSVAVARAHANDESRGVWISEVTNAVWTVISEFLCELNVYSLAWKRTDLTFKHRLIWSKGLQSRIRSVVDLINRDDDLWLPDRVPQGGQDLLAVLQVWERVSGDGGLTEILRLKISRCLSLHLDRVEKDSLPACMHNNHAELGKCWEATRPPQILHSTKCVDLWTTIFTALQACIDAASAQLSMNTCSQMMVRCVEKYCDNAREGFSNDVALSHPLHVKARRCFNRLVRSIEDDDSELPEVFKTKKKRRNRLFKKDAGAVASGGEESDEQPQIKTEGLNLIGDNHLLLSDYLVVGSRLGSQDSSTLMVRLHDFAFSLAELDKAKDTLKEAMEKEHARLARLFKSATKEESLPKLPKESNEAMLESIESGVSQAAQILTASGDLVSSYLALNLVFIDMRSELLERLYMPSTKDFPLSRILKKFESDKLTSFALLTPVKWQKPLTRNLLLNFVLAWVYVVADMAARGRVFKEIDSSVMNNDLTALHQFADLIALGNDAETQEVLRSVGSLPVYVSGSTPAEFKASCERALAEPTEKARQKNKLLLRTVVPPTSFKKPVVPTTTKFNN